ncbi:MAG TPA: 1-acyl-sn-glycerol-3-phosphate acyltransferase [Caldimonas sp.]
MESLPGALPVQLRGSALARTLLRLAGWHVAFDGLPAKQGVAIIYPHTSAWDFVIGMLAKSAIGFPVVFWSKDKLFRLPLFGTWLRWLGGVPVDRASPHGIVGQMARELVAARAEGRFLWLALSPEGTRRRTAGWRSGFYHVALEAGVPVALAYFDYRERVVGVEHFMMMSGDADADMAEIGRYLAHRHGRRPELAAPIRLET